jgi:hypothetical protein
MKAAEPIFAEGAFAKLFMPRNTHEEHELVKGKPGACSSTSANPAPLGSNSQNPSIHQEIRTQGVSLNRISSSVDELCDTMAELKNAFTALQVELNTSSHRDRDVDCADNSGDMLVTVLKELKVKSDEIERLKLENEVLRLKIKILEDRDTKPFSVVPPFLQTQLATIGEDCSPGLLTGNMKRTWPETFGTDHLRRNADSPDANNVSDDSSLADITMQSIKVPLKDASDFPKTPQDATISIIPPLRKNGLGGDPSAESVVGVSVIDNQLNIQQPATKRRRLSVTDDFQTPPMVIEEKRKRGRPRGLRKSTPTPLEEQDANAGSGAGRDENITQGSNTGELSNSKRLPSQDRSRRGRSRAPSTSRPITRSAWGKDTTQEENNATTNLTSSTAISAPRESPGLTAEQRRTGLPTQQDMEASSHTLNIHEKENHEDGSANKLRRSREMQERRKAQRAARDTLAKLAMEREEALAMPATED